MPSKAFLREQAKLRAAQERDRIAREQGRKPGPSKEEIRRRDAERRRETIIKNTAPKQVQWGLSSLINALTPKPKKKKKKK